MRIDKKAKKQIQVSQHFLQGLKTHKERFVQGAQKSLGPFLPPDQQHAVIHLWEAGIRALEESTHRLEAAEQTYVQENKSSESTRKQRDASFQKILADYNSLRYFLLGTYGPEVVDTLNLSGSQPVSVSQLLSNLKDAVKISAENFSLPTPLNPRITAWTIDTLKQELASMCHNAQEIFNNSQKAVHATKGAMTQKWKVYEEHQTISRSITALTEAFTLLAGEVDLGNRLQIIKARRSKKSAQNPTPSPTPIPSTEHS